ncbi:MAG: T9SS type A sorting domain-containing protein [Lewinellaceae bacterium]|nr:T9SS type A sorting domain-containing protein [Lewinellaceae bacterium]
MVLDASGNVYTAGYYSGTVDFNPGNGIFNLTSAGGINNDIFILKLDALGNFVWAKSMGGTTHDEAYSIALDASGNVYSTGYFGASADFDPGPSTFNLTSNGIKDIFISKLDAFGNFVWAKSMGVEFDWPFALAIDASGNVYSTGLFDGTADFDPGPGTYNLTSIGETDIFISKINASGNFVWAKSIGGILDDKGNSITSDASGNVYITGIYRGTVDFNPGPGVYNLYSPGNIFVCKLDHFGNFIWAGSIAGIYFEEGNAISVDAYGDVYTVGYFEGAVDFDPSAGIFNLQTYIGGGMPSSNGASDIFVQKMSLTPVSINELQNNIPIAVYPNPSNSVFTIETTSKSNFEIIDIKGRVILKGKINNPKTVIDLSGFESGIYFLAIESQSIKLIKM